MSYFNRILELVGDSKQRFYTGLLCGFLKNFSVLFMFYSLNIVFKNINNLDINIVKQIFILLIAGIIVHFIFRYLENILLSSLGYQFYRDYRLSAGQKLKKAYMGYFNEQHLGNIQGALTSVITALENFTMMLVTGIVNGFSIAIILTLAFFRINISLGFMMVVVLIAVALSLRNMYAIALKYIPPMHINEKEMNFSVIDLVRGMSVLKIFPHNNNILKNSIVEKAYSIYEEKRFLDINCEKEFARAEKLYSFIINISSVMLIILTVNLYGRSVISLADSMTMIIGAFLIFLGLLPLSVGIFLNVKIPSNQSYMDNVLNIPIIKDGNYPIEGKLNIKFKDVRFGYNEDREIIKGISFEIEEGSKVAVVGPSGSGKTTIVNLIARFWDINEGSISLANKDIRDYPVDELLSKLSMVFQDVYLFNDSVINNIRFAKPEASDEEIYEVCKKARCHEFILNMKDGYNTIIGEGGANLSGGEKQRISIARALLKDAPIILLDEATSSVDPENEAEILSAIDELCKGKTVISIAHRINTVKNADKILVIEDGRLVEEGKHDDLMALKGIYSRFVKSREDAKGWRIVI